MSKNVLVAYAGKYGATAGIAEKIGEVLQQAGLDTVVATVANAGDLSKYDAVVLGSAVYYGRWRKDAIKFITTNEKLLTGKSVWFFSSGPTEEGDDPVELLDGWTFPPPQQETADHIQPKGIAVFHGAMKEENLNFFEKWVLKKLNTPVGDFRDWDMIVSWTDNIAKELQ